MISVICAECRIFIVMLVSISQIFYEQLFHIEVFMCLQFGFVIFCLKDFGAKAAHKMLVKLTPECRCAKCCGAKIDSLYLFVPFFLQTGIDCSGFMY